MGDVLLIGGGRIHAFKLTNAEDAKGYGMSGNAVSFEIMEVEE